MKKLTERNSKLAYESRMLKKQGKITDTWVWNCRVLVKPKEETDAEKRTVYGKSMDDIAELSSGRRPNPQ